MHRALFSLFLLAACLIPSVPFAAEIDWNTITPYKVNLFYPGITTWEFLTSKEHGSTGRYSVLNQKKSCAGCHVSKGSVFDLRDQEIVSGSLRMNRSGKAFEPNPIKDKAPSIKAYIQAAYDGQYIYIRAQWDAAGKSWNTPDPERPDRLTFQINSARPEFAKFGCFINCHNDQNSMPDSPSKEKVAKHPYYAKRNRDDVRLYAFYTRNDGWDDMKDDAAIDELLKTGGLIDLWVVSLNGKTVETKDEFILADRLEDRQNDIQASGSWESGKYTVIIKRKLITMDEQDVQIKDNSAFNMGLAIHDDWAQKRTHYVSFPIDIGVGIEGTVTAVKIK